MMAQRDRGNINLLLPELSAQYYTGSFVDETGFKVSVNSVQMVYTSLILKIHFKSDLLRTRLKLSVKSVQMDLHLNDTRFTFSVVVGYFCFFLGM